MVADREMLREIFIKDFDNFCDRMVSCSFKMPFKVTHCGISFLKLTVMGQKVEQLLLMIQNQLSICLWFQNYLIRGPY